VKFEQLAWGAVCFYYRSSGDHKYADIIKDHAFIRTLRINPEALSLEEFEQKVIYGYLNLDKRDQEISHKVSEKALPRVILLKKDVISVQKENIHSADLDNKETCDFIDHIYSGLFVDGLWITGVSKIAHLLNDQLLPPVDRAMSSKFKMGSEKFSVMPLLRTIKREIQEAEEDYLKMPVKAAMEDFISESIGYTSRGFRKSLIKLVSEYYWLLHSEGLPIPPKWIPSRFERDSYPKDSLDCDKIPCFNATATACARVVTPSTL
jgi:hypothetical protein